MKWGTPKDGARAARGTVGLLAAYTAGSSLLGLATPIAILGPGVIGVVWGTSLLADLVFVVGSAGTAYVGFHLWRIRRPVESVTWGALVTWIVYAASFALVGDASGEFAQDGRSDVFSFVGRFGWPGILFGALAPGLWALYERKKELADRAPVTVDPPAGGPDRPPH